MLTSLTATLILPKGERLNQSMGSVMQGILMDKVDPAWAKEMHTMSLRPYSQYLTVEDGRIQWHIGTLTDDAYQQIAVPLRKVTKLHSRQKGYDIELMWLRESRRAAYDDIARIYWGDPARIHHVDLTFLTSASFKTEDTYAIFPGKHLLFRSLIRKWNLFTDGATLDEKDLSDHLAEAMGICDYHLHMHPYSIEGKRISAFRGSLRLGFFENDMTARMTAMLADFATFAGIGIKTALGMGGVASDVSYWKEGTS